MLPEGNVNPFTSIQIPDSGRLLFITLGFSHQSNEPVKEMTDSVWSERSCQMSLEAERRLVCPGESLEGPVEKGLVRHPAV